jgi:D-alanyl-D-alanine carboxypeptidase
MDDEKLDENSEWVIENTTKIFTLSTLIIMRNNGIINWDDKVSKYITLNKNNKKKHFNKLKIIDLINHTSGLKRNYHSGKTRPGIKNKKYKSATDIVSAILKYHDDIFEHKYGDYNISNLGYTILGAIIEQIEEDTYLNVFKKYIIDTLEMAHTNMGITNMTHYANDKKVNKQTFMNRYVSATSACLYSSAVDLIKLMTNLKKLLTKKGMVILKENINKESRWYKKNTIYFRSHKMSNLTIIIAEYDDNWDIIKKSVKITFDTNNEG